MKIDLYLTPVPFQTAQLENKAVVVIDVLRASTSICAALSAGAKAVIPTDGRGEAGDMWSKIGSETSVLAGEQDGLKIENFQLGNSPLEFTDDAVNGKFVIMSTTNGTPVFGKAYNAGPVISGALVNISKVVEKINDENKDIVVVCSGRDGHFSIEDTICGGMLIHLLKEKHNIETEINDAGRLALLLYQTNKTKIKEAIAQGEHAKYLESIGFGKDVDFATTVDLLPVVPILKDGQLIIEK